MVPTDGTQSRADDPRRARAERRTAETEVTVELTLDGRGGAQVDTGIGFFDHMLGLLARHGRFDLEVDAKGDLGTGPHHTVEDVGICLGRALSESVGSGAGIQRYGSSFLPMDEALSLVSLDFSGRPFLAYEVELSTVQIGGFDADLTEEFFQAVVNNARLTLHIRLLAGSNPHHMVESVFKGFGRALDEATGLDGRSEDVPSTKGVL